jgi:hypothetical protein
LQMQSPPSEEKDHFKLNQVQPISTTLCSKEDIDNCRIAWGHWPSQTVFSYTQYNPRGWSCTVIAMSWGHCYSGHTAIVTISKYKYSSDERPCFIYW